MREFKKVVTTRLDDELFSMLSNDFAKYGGQYKTVREIIRQHYQTKGKAEEAKDIEEIKQSGNVIEDSKNLAESKVPTAMIKKIIAEMDNQRKIKNSMKKAGSFHEENALVDLASMIKYGKPTFHELRYFFDFWYNMAVCLNAISLRGNRMTKAQRQTMLDLENPLPNPNPRTSLEESIKRTRVSKKRT